MRTKKIALNIVSDILPYILIGVVGLLKVKYLITYIGDDGNGYYQFINQVISYVFLAQGGFSQAVIYSLYKPFAEKNKDDINAIYSGARYIFKKIGFLIFGIIVLTTIGLSFFYSKNISILITFFIISTSYLIAYFGRTQTYTAVLTSNQEKYISSIVLNFMKLLCDILTIVVIVKFRTLESVAILILCIKIVEEFIMRLVVKKHYPWLHVVANRNTSMKRMTKDLIWVQFGYLVLNNVDSILIMMFMGPVYVSIYTSYTYIMRYLNEVSSRISGGVESSFGNVFASGEKKRAREVFKELQVLYIIITFSMCLTYLVGIKSFVNIWIGDSKYLLDYHTVILFTLILFFNMIYYPLVSIMNANGMFRDSKNQVMICASINLIFSIILINFFGLDGILFATALGFLVSIYLKCNVINKKVFKEEKLITILSHYIKASLVFIVLCYLIKYIEPIVFIHINGLISCLLVLFIVFIINLLFVILGMFLVDKENVKNIFSRFSNLIRRKKVA